MEAKAPRPGPWSLGLDLGSAAAKVALCDSGGGLVRGMVRQNQGRPLAALLSLLEELATELGAEALVRAAITGSGQGLLRRAAPLARVNEVVATAHGVSMRPGRAGDAVRTVVDLGGQFSKWILLAPDTGEVEDFATNGLCAAGAGAFLEQQASRLELSLEELGRLAVGAARGATIAGRCSVFAKSDMIHLQQKGTPIAEIAFGLCRALVRTFRSTVLRGRDLEAPVVLCGGGAQSPGLVRAFALELGFGPPRLLPAPEPLHLGAIGAASLAADAPSVTLEELCAEVRGELRRGRASGGALVPLTAGSDGDPRPAEDPPPAEGTVEAFLGVDVGSVSTNLVLLDRDGRVLQGIYLPTRGQPVAVLNQGLSQIAERYGNRLRVLHTGATGSGRHLAMRVLGADVVHNEITAQMVSSAFFQPEVDTIFEIGGQDSKYIAVRDGRLADFEMNKICAAGTGSFLEEQAQRLGVAIVGEFASLALRAAEPVDLGTRCTVFMDSELVRAQQRGASIADLCAGLAYSVARNYLEKVVGGRAVGRTVMFQGGTASNAAVVAAFRQVLGKTVVVHPYNRISGAIGAALLAQRAHRDAPGPSRFLGLAACATPEVRSFECPRCENRCRVNRIRLEERVVHFGDACDRYAERDRERASNVERPFPELFTESARLLEEHLAAACAGPPAPLMGLLRASLNLDHLPFWAAFLRAAGYQPVVSGRTTPRLLQEHACGVPSEVCLPVKLAEAHARSLLGADRVPRIFIPSLLECPHPGDERAHTCFYVQELADMLRTTLPDRVVSAQFGLEDGIIGLLEPVLALAEALGCSREGILRALRQARERQERFRAAQLALGRQALHSRFERAVVVLGKPYNLHDSFLNLSLARHLTRVDLPAIPADLLPLESIQLDPRWDNLPWHYSRQQLKAIELVHRDERLFPLLVSCYGCGPDGFTSKHLEELLAHRPRLMLEFDEHQGEAGLVTRLEAFADEIDEHLRSGAKRKRPAPPVSGSATPRRGRTYFVPNIGHAAPIYAAALRAVGEQAVVLPMPDEDTIRTGEQFASGRECHPWTVMAGELVQWLRQHEPRDGDTFLSPCSNTPCLLRQYGDAYRILIRRHGLPAVEVADASMAWLEQALGKTGLLRLYEGLLAADIIFSLATRLRPYEVSQGSMDRLFGEGLQQISRSVEAHRSLAPVLRELTAGMWRTPANGRPRSRPVVGVTGDLYTRLHPIGNADLFRRLESLGCEVWPSPFFADLADLAASVNAPRSIQRGRIREAFYQGLAITLTSAARHLLVRGLPEEITELVVEPSPDEIRRLARPYLGSRSNFLILQVVAKIVDFLQRGAAGVINAAGINCMVGTTVASVIPAIRADFHQAPVINLIYGGTEGPAQEIRLETFVHQVMQERPLWISSARHPARHDHHHHLGPRAAGPR